jgi:hypothetical protein
MHPLRHRRLTSWVAVLAMWFAALAPTVSHALVWTGGAGGVEVCTPTGMQVLSFGAATAASDDAAALRGVFEHCGYCVLGAGAAPLPSVGCALPPVVEAPGLAGQPLLRPALQAPAWMLLPSRAPPGLF